MAPLASAAQHLINPGDDWQSKVGKFRPGDEIILMPGRHRPASFDRLAGTAEAPIIIRGASPQKPSIIASQLDGIRVKEGAHLVIQDLQISGGSASGIWIGAAQPESETQAAEPDAVLTPRLGASNDKVRTQRARDILIRNVSISKIGPRGQRHGIFLTGFVDVRIDGVRIEGWGGSAIELLACEDVAITKSQFRGIEDHSQNCGVRARAGCDRVNISGCRFENAGDFVISMGGKSNPEDFVPPIPADAASASLAEATRVQVEHCTIIGGLCAAAFIHAEHCNVQANTIVRPRRCALGLLNDSPDVRIKPTGPNVFGANLVFWQAGDIVRLAEVAEGVNGDALVLEPNLWWSNESLEDRRKLGPLPGKDAMEQQFDLDPKLDKNFKPTVPAARAFGAG
jgi:hypothetical protein